LKIIKIKLASRGFFFFFTMFFCLLLSYYMRGNLLINQILKNIKVGATCALFSAYAYWLTRVLPSSFLKMSFYLVFRSVIASFSCWCDTCQQWWSGLSPVGLSLPPFFYSPRKLQFDLFCCWYFNFIFYSFDF
jgi:hypothetical protein